MSKRKEKEEDEETFHLGELTEDPEEFLAGAKGDSTSSHSGGSHQELSGNLSSLHKNSAYHKGKGRKERYSVSSYSKFVSCCSSSKKSNSEDGESSTTNVSNINMDELVCMRPKLSNS